MDQLRTILRPWMLTECRKAKEKEKAVTKVEKEITKVTKEKAKEKGNLTTKVAKAVASMARATTTTQVREKAGTPAFTVVNLDTGKEIVAS